MVSKSMRVNSRWARVNVSGFTGVYGKKSKIIFFTGAILATALAKVVLRFDELTSGR